ncbi:TPA: alpha/beta fold hydrolase [Serratia fonticola]|uniref:Arylesterase n=1 Tax=Serratia fonticola TaxID=47917 RepID=A0A448SQA9_SERFO|nr:alpha/beta fold hydrolase [Serratia fonticola]CAI1667695.1 Arylesterase [Serratia fonticola]CAI1856274.1 Arylesterase [Serratia fonticola]CAI2462212.1 Arylesterase [Serratia fonticola]VEI69945.1 Arylesterase [Serratia fonticola]
MEILDSPMAANLSVTEVVQAYFSAFAQGDIERAVGLLDDDVVWHIDGSSHVSTVGILQGKAQVRCWLESFLSNFKPREFVISELIDHHENVVALGRFRHTVLSTGNTVGSDMVVHFKVANSRIARYQIFEDSALLGRAFDPADRWQQQQLKINHTLYRYWERGEGPTLIFAHGLFVNHEVFTAQVNALSESYRCIVFDMPGHGQSGYHPDGWTLDDLCRDIALMILELSLAPVTFIGQSQGGMVGIRLAARYPGLVSGLVLIGTSARAEFPERLDHWQRQREIIINGAEQQREAVFSAIQHHINGATWLLNNPGEVLHERGVMLAHDRAGLVLALDAAVFTRGDVQELLPLVKVPTLVICGEHDTATPVELSREIAEAIENASLAILTNVGHHPTIEAPTEVTEAISEFLCNV